MVSELPTVRGDSYQISVVQLGARMNYAVARLLYASGNLRRFHTDICAAIGLPALISRSALLRNRLPAMRRLAGRVPSGIPPELISHYPTFGLELRYRLSRVKSLTDRTRLHLWAGQTICKKVLGHRSGCGDAIYAFNSAALELFRRAREQGATTILEQTIAPRRVEQRLLTEEWGAWPRWELGGGADALADLYGEREEAEWGLADIILAGSEFVANGISELAGPRQRVKIVPYGVDPVANFCSAKRRRDKLNVLFCGRLGLRKGAPYLLQAARLSHRSQITFRAVGSVECTPSAIRAITEFIEVVGPVSRAELSGHYRWADVFVLPSLCEGSATVSYEALAAGLPVITTPNAGTVVRDGVDGFVVPIRDSSGIAERLHRLAGEKGLLEQMSRNALERASGFTLARYGTALRTAIGLQ